ncbi:hypothetical protein SUL00_01630 [Streptococcus pneumoniae]|uniref:hypothetical protein n=1 Tax=Streptococcus pneumoniae TaxID=1313 RepID=UPI0002B95A6D|nr:hypothetical protein [Streptococcus pneumoniae]MDY6720519.1 hypothetical protein [Streptococcus pneumoniae]BDS67804.1 hypothetical protein PC0027_17090 [Streptococcus pneumoniae]
MLLKCELFDQITFPAGRIKEDIGTNYELFMQVKNNLYIVFERLAFQIMVFQKKMIRDNHDLRLERIAMVA